MKKAVSPGVYQIRNQMTGDTYIGSSHNLGYRWEIHLNDLHARRHRNARLQAAWDMYGQDAFAFEVLETVDDASRVREREQWYLSTCKPTYNLVGIRQTAPVQQRNRPPAECPGYSRVADVCAQKQVSPQSMYQWIREGKLQSYRVPGLRGSYLKDSDVESFFAPRPRPQFANREE